MVQVEHDPNMLLALGQAPWLEEPHKNGWIRYIYYGIQTWVPTLDDMIGAELQAERRDTDG